MMHHCDAALVSNECLVVRFILLDMWEVSEDENRCQRIASLRQKTKETKIGGRKILILPDNSLCNTSEKFNIGSNGGLLSDTFSINLPPM